MWRRLVLGLWLVFWGLCGGLRLHQALAQEFKLEISGPEVIKIPVAVPEFEGPLPLAHQLAIIARHDLDLQLIFKVLGQGFSFEEGETFQALGVQYLVKGRISQAGRYVRTEFFLYDLTAGGKLLLARAYRGPQSAARYMVHRFQDLVVQAITGVPGVAYSRIAYVQRGPKGDRLVVEDFDGYQRTVVAAREGLILYPRFSPDGRYLAFVSYRRGRPEIDLLDLSTGRRRVLCHFPGLNAYPVWHPSGKRLVVTLSKDGNPDLYLIDLKGHVLRRLTHGEGVNTGGSFSPDGEELAFVSDRGGSPQIYILNMLTGAIRRLTFSGSYNTSPCWSPKGDRIVYAGMVHGRFALFTISPDGGNPVQITTEGDFEAPVFAPNGRLILCQGRTAQGQGLYLLLANGAARMLYQTGKQLYFPAWAKLP